MAGCRTGGWEQGRRADGGRAVRSTVGLSERGQEPGARIEAECGRPQPRDGSNGPDGHSVIGCIREPLTDCTVARCLGGGNDPNATAKPAPCTRQEAVEGSSDVRGGTPAPRCTTARWWWSTTAGRSRSVRNPATSAGARRPAAGTAQSSQAERTSPRPPWPCPGPGPAHRPAQRTAAPAHAGRPSRSIGRGAVRRAPRNRAERLRRRRGSSAVVGRRKPPAGRGGTPAPRRHGVRATACSLGTRAHAAGSCCLRSKERAYDVVLVECLVHIRTLECWRSGPRRHCRHAGSQAADRSPGPHQWSAAMASESGRRSGSCPGACRHGGSSDDPVRPGAGLGCTVWSLDTCCGTFRSPEHQHSSHGRRRRRLHRRIRPGGGLWSSIRVPAASSGARPQVAPSPQRHSWREIASGPVTEPGSCTPGTRAPAGPRSSCRCAGAKVAATQPSKTA